MNIIQENQYRGIVDSFDKEKVGQRTLEVIEKKLE